MRPAIAGLAIAALPDGLVRDDSRAGRLVLVLPRWSARPIPLGIIYLGDRQRPARVQAFIAFVEAHLASLVEAAGSTPQVDGVEPQR